ncbi:unnamed protein product [Phyllotreta striolata]|uniref:Uncharacterized protein n=1 Tax=Phyllotreta striolata TaxID=444603 RepID=A0A9N9TGQ6_PHYSR|nr:unnamed protein product [Phyllotreta striolata]
MTLITFTRPKQDMLADNTDEELDLQPTKGINSEQCTLVGDAMYCKIIKALRAPVEFEYPRIPYSTLRSLPTREYLDEVLVPILLKALNYIARRRPPDAVKGLAVYLMKNRRMYETVDDDILVSDSEAEVPSTGSAFSTGDYY